jgi:hypothetical protein
MWKNLTGAFAGAAVGVVVFAVGTPANAVPLSETLTDLNSTASYSANTQVGSNAIQVSWVVDGVSQLFEQNFYIDLTGTTNNVPTNLANVAPTQFIASNTNFNPGDDKLVVQWADIGGSGITVQVDFGLTGFPAGTMLSDIAETISITNSSDSAQAIRFFQYVDFDLDGTGAGDTASSSTSPVKSVLQTGEGSSVSETVVTPGPSLYQVGDSTIDSAVIEVGDDLSTCPQRNRRSVRVMRHGPFNGIQRLPAAAPLQSARTRIFASPSPPHWDCWVSVSFCWALPLAVAAKRPKLTWAQRTFCQIS